jgi:hypothetical protein
MVLSLSGLGRSFRPFGPLFFACSMPAFGERAHRYGLLAQDGHDDEIGLRQLGVLGLELWKILSRGETAKGAMGSTVVID